VRYGNSIADQLEQVQKPGSREHDQR
jgi:hypothetical protein